MYGPIKMEWKPNDTVECSGVYKVRHGNEHKRPGTLYTLEDQVICTGGARFPPRNRCGSQPCFILLGFGNPIEQDENFKIERRKVTARLRGCTVGGRQL